MWKINYYLHIHIYPQIDYELERMNLAYSRAHVFVFVILCFVDLIKNSCIEQYHMVNVVWECCRDSL
jgi:hypothetical protein